jgi:two-component system sensor histidine kinase PilS (NtrC family)
LPAQSNSPSAIAEVSRSAPGLDLRLKLIWLTVFRTVGTTSLLGVFAARLLSQPATDELFRQNLVPFVLIGLVYLVTLIFGVILRWGRVGKGLAYIQVLGDILLASSLVYVTGGSESPFTFTYSMAVIASSILLEPPVAFVAAGVSSLSFGAVALLIRAELLVRPVLESGHGPLDRFVFLLVSNTLAQFLIAALASYLSRQLRAAGGKLSVKEADLRKLGQLQRQILACMPSGLITCRTWGNITFMNRAASSILNLDATGTRPENIEGLIPGALKVVPGARRSEITVDADGSRRVLGLSVTPLEGTADALLVVFQDLTEVRRLEYQLHRIDHLAALGALSAQLAHEIHNPLAAMRGSAQLLAAEAAEDGASKRLADVLIRESDRLTTLVQDFLHFARPPPPSLRACLLSRLVTETVELLRADPLASGVNVQTTLSDVTAIVDSDQIRQVLLNLLRNACQAVGGGGAVRVQLEQDSVGARIRVWDSAGSIPESHLSCIFDPFFTTRETGTGLGLSIAHSIVQAHGGLIRVTSSPVSGTEFVVGLPRTNGVAIENFGR